MQRCKKDIKEMREQCRRPTTITSMSVQQVRMSSGLLTVTKASGGAPLAKHSLGYTKWAKK